MTLPLLLHVGYPRAASTWLQTAWFGQQPELQPLGRRRPVLDWMGPDGPVATPALHDALWQGVNHADHATFARSGLVDRVRDEVAAVRDPRRVPVVSQEMLTWSMFGRVDLHDRARRLRALFPDDVRVLLVVREQQSFIRSLYQICLRGLGLAVSLDEFAQWWVQWPELGNSASLRYDEVAAMYDESFGTEHVLVLPYEQLRRDPLAFESAIRRHVGLAPLDRPLGTAGVNTSPSRDASWVHLLVNEGSPHHLGGGVTSLPTPQTWLHHAEPRATAINAHYREEMRRSGRVWNLPTAYPAGLPDRVPPVPDDFMTVTPGTAELFDETYGGANRRLSDRTGIDVGRLGYTVARRTPPAGDRSAPVAAVPSGGHTEA